MTAAAVPIAAVVLTLGGCSGGASSPTAAGNSSPAQTRSVASASGSTALRRVAPVPVESNPPGDIPDNVAYVPYSSGAGQYAFSHPEGWARTVSGARVRFTDKLNGVMVEASPANNAPTVAAAQSVDVPRLARSVPAFQLRGLAAVSVPGGNGVRIVFRRNSEPDAVTGKVYRDEVEEYLVYRSGRLVRMDLFGPVGADNVDAYRTMSQSLRIR